MCEVDNARKDLGTSFKNWLDQYYREISPQPEIGVLKLDAGYIDFMVYLPNLGGLAYENVMLWHKLSERLSNEMNALPARLVARAGVGSYLRDVPNILPYYAVICRGLVSSLTSLSEEDAWIASALDSGDQEQVVMGIKEVMSWFCTRKIPGCNSPEETTLVTSQFQQAFMLAYKRAFWGLPAR
jgi:hypothetical protein